ncbi:MAG: hypothetical protein ACJ71S_02025 [Acidobacteriaceae bacterium]
MRQLGARLPVPPEETDVVETPQSVPSARPADRSVPHAPSETEAPQAEPYPVERHRIEPQRVDSGPAVTPPPPAHPRQTEPTGVRSEKDWAERPHGAQADNPVQQAANPAGRAANRAGHAVDSARVADNAAASAAYRARLADSAASLPDSPAARWAEFHDFRRPEPGRGGRLNFESMLQQDDQSWVRPRMRQEREHHFPFLTLAVPGIAAILAVGALLWSGSLRDRVRQQDAAMNALQEQNHKLADTLAQMNVDQKTTSALDGNADLPHAPVDAQNDANGATAASQQSPQQPTTPATSPQPSEAESQPTSDSGAAGTPVAKQSNGETKNRGAGNRQGVSTPPPMGQGGRTPRQQNGSRNRPVDAAYTPELVPPYPTHFQPQNVAANAAASQPVPSAGVSNGSSPPSSGTTSSGTTTGQGTSTRTGQAAPSSYVPPVSVPSSPRASVPQPSGSQTGVTQLAKSNVGRGAAPPPAASPAPPATSYNATADGSYVSPLAQNIETVEGLQRHSPVPLREFHADQGRIAKVTPNLGVSVRRPDPRRGTYALVVDEGGKHYQVTGQVNSPLTLSDSAAHREYTLVVLHIDNQQVYGYLRPMQ